MCSRTPPASSRRTSSPARSRATAPSTSPSRRWSGGGSGASGRGEEAWGTAARVIRASLAARRSCALPGVGPGGAQPAAAWSSALQLSSDLAAQLVDVKGLVENGCGPGLQRAQPGFLTCERRDHDRSWQALRLREDRNDVQAGQPCMRTSVIRRCGRGLKRECMSEVSMYSSSALPLETVATSYPSSRRTDPSRFLRSRSSSASRIRGWRQRSGPILGGEGIGCTGVCTATPVPISSRGSLPPRRARTLQDCRGPNSYPGRQLATPP